MLQQRQGPAGAGSKSSDRGVACSNPEEWRVDATVCLPARRGVPPEGEYRPSEATEDLEDRDDSAESAEEEEEDVDGI